MNLKYAKLSYVNVPIGIQIVRSNFVRGQTIQGLVVRHKPQHSVQLATGLHTPLATGLIYDSRTGALVLNGRPGQLQFFNVINNRQLFNVCTSTLLNVTPLYEFYANMCGVSRV